MFLSIATFLVGCGDEPATSAGAPPIPSERQPLRSGTEVGVERMKGVIELSNTKDGTRCTALLLNHFSILTTAHCAARLTRPGDRDEHTWGVMWNSYAWYEDTGYIKHCYNSISGVCPEGPNKAEDKDIRFFSLSMSPENDVAILRRAWYPIYANVNNFADIYLDDITPANTPRLQLYSWGMLGNGVNDPLSKPRTGTMRVVETTPGSIKLVADQIQSCSGDEGGPWSIPGAIDASRNPAVALVSRFTPDGSGCSAVNGTEYAVRLANKADWIQSVDGQCVRTVNNAGQNVLRCSGASCDGAPFEEPGWDGCRGSGCAVCAEVIDSYPRYFENHRNCTRNTTCAGQFFRCSSQCPPPTEADR